MTQETWTAVDDYYAGLLATEDEALQNAVAATEAAGMPLHQVSALQGKFLMLMVQITGARRVLEIGTLGGYSTIWLARALPEGGRLITLEADASHIDVARRNIERAGLTDKVEMRLGKAVNTLATLIDERARPFDLIFIDADKPSNPAYLEYSLRLARPGTVIIADNVVRGGAVIEAESTDANVQGIRRFNELLASDPRISSTVLQTVGSKGYDGFAMGIVKTPQT